jgi:protease IV
VAAALADLRASGKQIVAFSESMDQGHYLLAAQANEVYLDPMGGVMLTGIGRYRQYYRTGLQDKLGVDMQLFRVGEYKSAAEPYILDAASPASKEADLFWMNDIWNRYLGDVAKARKLTPEQLSAGIDTLPEGVAANAGDLGKLALQQKLVDGLKTREDIEKLMTERGVADEDADLGFRSINLDAYLAQIDAKRSPIDERPQVAVVVAEGEITGGEQPAGRIGGVSTSALLREARDDDKVKAVVLRVNSPGGEVYAAEQIRREVELTREAGIPVVVSMGDVAASGGYWISMNANRIYAEPNTITGSIGIFGMFFTVPDTLSKIGVKSDGVGTSPLAGAFDITRPLDPKVGVLIQSIIDKGYRDFVGGVARARGKDFAAIDSIAQGRVWTGEQAMQRGLVDRLGNLQDAIADAAQQASLGKDFSVRYAEKPMGAFERFLTSVGDSSEARVALSWGVHLPSWVAELPKLAPEFALFRTAEAGKPHVYAYCFCSPR